MEFISNYIKNIGVFIIFITLIGIISPTDKYKKYIKLILGFILIFVVISPISSLLKNNNFSVDNLMVKMAYSPEQDFEDTISQNDLIIQNYEAELEAQVSNILKNNQKYALENCFFNIDKSEENFGAIKSIGIILNEKTADKKNKLIRIEKVVISEPVSEENDIQNEELNLIKNSISGFYNLSGENIYITVHENTKE